MTTTKAFSPELAAIKAKLEKTLAEFEGAVLDESAPRGAVKFFTERTGAQLMAAGLRMKMLARSRRPITIRKKNP